MQYHTLKFEDNDQDKERFFMVYQGFIGGGSVPSQTGQPKGMTTIRLEDKVLTKFESISIPEMIEGPQNEMVAGLFRVLQAGGGEVKLEQPEFELLKRYFERADWRIMSTHKVVRTIDWLSSIPLAEG